MEPQAWGTLEAREVVAVIMAAYFLHGLNSLQEAGVSGLK